MTFKITDNGELHSLEAFIWSESDFASFQYFSEVLSAGTWMVPDAAHTELCGMGLPAFRLPGTTVPVQERPDCIRLAMLSVPTKNLVFMGDIASSFKPSHHAVYPWLHPSEQERKGGEAAFNLLAKYEKHLAGPEV